MPLIVLYHFGRQSITTYRDFHMITRWPLFFILALMALQQIAIDLYLPSTPAMVHVFHASATAVQLTLAFYVLSAAISGLFYGPLSDHFGRKPVMLIGASIYIVGSVLCCASESIFILLIGRLIQGLGAGFAVPISRTIVRDLTSDKKLIVRITSYQSMTFSCVPLIAPVIGGFIEHWLNWRVNFIVLLAIGVVMWCLILIKYVETNPVEHHQPLQFRHIFNNYFAILKQPDSLGYMLVVAVQFGCLLSVIQLSPFILQNQLGYNAFIYGWFILVVGLGSLVGAYVNRHVSQQYDLDKILLVAVSTGFLLMIAMLLLNLKWFNAWIIVLPVFLLRFTGGLTYSNAVTQVMHKNAERAGAASAFFGAAVLALASLMSAAVAHLPSHSHVTLALSLTVLMSVSLVALIFVVLIKRKL